MQTLSRDLQIIHSFTCFKKNIGRNLHDPWEVCFHCSAVWRENINLTSNQQRGTFGFCCVSIVVQMSLMLRCWCWIVRVKVETVEAGVPLLVCVCVCVFGCVHFNCFICMLTTHLWHTHTQTERERVREIDRERERDNRCLSGPHWALLCEKPATNHSAHIISMTLRVCCWAQYIDK